MDVNAQAAALKRVLRVIVDLASPGWVTHLRNLRWLSREARLLHERCLRSTNLEDIVDTVMESEAFRPEQNRSEILALLRLLLTTRPRHLCEVGGLRGGTLALFAHVAAPNARLLSLDIAYTATQIKVYPRFATGQQQITCIPCDSHAAESQNAVRNWLNGEKLDFLFIDGDHSFAGVAKDFSLYSPFVRRGGILAFHDIVPDSTARHGVPSSAYAGDVPAFWNELRKVHNDISELVENPNQDGYGIGVLRWPGDPVAHDAC